MFTIKEIVETVNGRLVCGNENRRINKVCTDTRKIKPDNLFLAIKGEKFDGHCFLGRAIEKGAAAAVVSEAWISSSGYLPEKPSVALIAAGDCVRALADLAAHHRRKFKIPVIAVTGSNGKTTAKQMIFQVLSSRFNTLKSAGSFNNHIGVPLSLLEMTSRHEAAVFELGMNHKGEISSLARIAAPDIGVITSIGPAHLEFFRGIEEIIKAKCELFECMADGKTAVINADSPGLYEEVKKHISRIVTYGMGPGCSWRAAIVEADDKHTVFRLNEGQEFKLNVIGRHNVYNALAAIAVGSLFGISPEEIKESLKSFAPAELRMQVVEVDGIKLIADCYNANPQSVCSAVDTLAALNGGGNKGIVLADMLELGDKSAFLHAEIGRKVAESGINFLVAVGEKASYTADAARESGLEGRNIFRARDNKEAADICFGLFKRNDIVLLKGSRGMKLEQIIEYFKRKVKDG